MAVTAPAAAAPGTPGTPADPVPVFTEDFQNNANADMNVSLGSYHGAAGTTYKADAYWLNRTNCNGFIVDAGSTRRGTPDGHTEATNPGGTLANVTGDCSGANQPFGAFSYMKSLAYALGALHNPDTAAQNYAAASYTQGNGTNNQVQFETVEPLNVKLANRFVVFSVDAAAHSCVVADGKPPRAMLKFALKTNGTEIAATNKPIDVCADPRGKNLPVTIEGYWGQSMVKPYNPYWIWSAPKPSSVRVGSYTSDKGLLITSNDGFGLKLINETGTGIGNDGAFDNIRVLDVTPQLDKSFNPTRVAVGGTSRLTLTVTNTSERAEKNGWAFTDTLPEGLVVAATPNVSTTCAAATVNASGSTIAVTGGKINAGETICAISVDVTSQLPPETEIERTFTNGPSNFGTSIVGLNPPGDATVTFFRTPALTLEKTANPVTVAAVGETVTYSFAVRNTGNVTLSNISVTESDSFTGTGGKPTVTCPAEPLAPGNTATCTATYTATQADVDRGSILNTATAHGTPPAPPGGETPPPVNSNESEAIVTSPTNPGISVLKTATPTTVTTAGETVTYNFAVRNTGNVTLSNISVTESDSFTGTGGKPTVTCPAEPLTPGNTVNCSATYTATQADVDRGSILNKATAHGTPPTPEGGETPPPVNSDESPAVVTSPTNPGISVKKTATPTTVATVGETVTYSFLVRNTGNVTLTDVTVTEKEFSPGGAFPTVTCPETTLAPNGTMTCSASYIATQADLDRGSIVNTAVALGTPPTPEGGTPPRPIESEEDRAIVTSPTSASLALEKTANPVTVAAAGETVTYSFAVRNTGNVTLSNISVTESSFTGTGGSPAVTCPAGPLAPGASVTCTASYTATQADVDRGNILNKAIAHGTPPTPEGGATPPPVDSNESEAIVTSPTNANLTVEKTANPVTVAAAGETVTYSFAVRNTGNVTLSNISVTESSFTGTGGSPAVTCPAGDLAPGASVTCTASYTVTQADVDRGNILNKAIAHGTPPTPEGGATPPPVDSNESEAIVTSPTNASLALEKTADPVTVAAVGETVTYSFAVRNTGNVTLSNIAIAEKSFTGSGGTPAVTCPAGPLAPGASVTCTAPYTATQADVDRGSIENRAIATGVPPTPEGGATPPPVESNESPATVTIPATPAVTIVKSVSPVTNNLVAGMDLTYTFLITNTGNVTLTNVGVSEHEFNGAGALGPITCQPGAASLAAGAQVTCEATYKVVQADVDRGRLKNTATASGTPPTPPGGVTPPAVNSPPSTVEVPATQTPSISMVKSASVKQITAAGQDVTFRFAVTNTGNVSITDVKVQEVKFSGTGNMSAVTCPAGSLVPGATVTCEATYTTTQADVDAKELTNTARATGVPPTNPGEPPAPPVESPDSEVTIPSVQEPKLDLVKSASLRTVTKPGQLITYTFAVTNSGNVTIKNLVINEEFFSGAGKMSAVTCPVTELAPGKSTECTATYTTTKADMKKEPITNDALAYGSVPDGTSVTSEVSSAKVLVIPPVVKPLPTTGADIGPSVALGAGLLLLGAGLVALSSRRRQQS